MEIPLIREVAAAEHGLRQAGQDGGPATPWVDSAASRGARLDLGRRSWRAVVEQVKRWARIHSPWAIHFNSGSCNGCDIEILATLTPRYDLERFGVQLQGSPRHADVLLCTGPVTRQARDRLLRVYAQMPEPKFVIAVGSCALSGGVFHGCYNVVGHIDDVIPVDVYVPGCPPRPEAIIDGIVKLLQKLEGGKGR